MWNIIRSPKKMRGTRFRMQAIIKTTLNSMNKVLPYMTS